MPNTMQEIRETEVVRDSWDMVFALIIRTLNIHHWTVMNTKEESLVNGI